MPYRDCVAVQTDVLESVAAGRQYHTLILVEHEPVLTLGANFHAENLLLPLEEYAQRGIEIEVTDRGGDITYHGPGQLVVYPIFNLNELGKDLHLWLRNLEETIIVALREFDVEGFRFPPNTGVWVEGVERRKIAAIGIKVRRWVSMHGIAINCDNDLSVFNLITPCGIREYGVTSLSAETGATVGVADAKAAVVRSFEKVFGLQV